MLLLPEFGKAGTGKAGKKLCNNSCGRREREIEELCYHCHCPPPPLAFNAAESKTTVAERHSVLFPEMVHGGQGTVPGGVAVEFSPVLLVARG